MGKVGKFIVGGLLILGGLAVGVFTGNWTLGLVMASTGVGLLTAPKGDLGSDQGAILQTRMGTQNAIPVVYGTTKIAGVYVDVRVDTNSTERKRLVIVIAWCLGSRDGGGITAIDEVWFDDRKVISGSTVQAPFNTTVPGQSFPHLQVTHYLGTSSQTVDATLAAMFPAAWPSTSRGRGIAYSVFQLWWNPDIYPSGLPSTIQAVIRGARVEDPRDGVWKFTSNPAICIRDFLLSPIYGQNVAAANIDDQSFIDMANYCEELVNIPGSGAGLRYTLDGWVDGAKPVMDNLARLTTACRGLVVNEGSLWRLVIRRQRVPTGFVIDESNTVEGSWKYVLPGNEVPNIVRATYIDPAQQYAPDVVQWPAPGAANSYLTADNGYESRLEIDLPYTPNRARAQQLAMTLLKEARAATTIQIGLLESALSMRLGDLVAVTQPSPGWTGKIFDVVALLLQPDGGVQAVLGEYSAAAYDLDAQATPDPIPGTSLPNPFVVPDPGALVLVSINQGLQMDDGRWLPRIRVTWAKSNDPFIDYYDVQAKKSTDASWDSFGRVPGAETAIMYVYPVTAESWDVRVSAVNRLGKRSNWVSATNIVFIDDPRPQVLSITLVNSHVDVGHVDVHTDVAHGDSAHVDAHTDAHTDVQHGDQTVHGDSHTDAAHGDSHTDTHGDGDHHVDIHGDYGHTDAHNDAVLSHDDVAHTDSHTDTHTDTSHSDTAHGDGHTDAAHSDGLYGLGAAIQADTDSASVRAVARKHQDVAHADHVDGSHSDVAHTDVTNPTAADVRTQGAVNGRNVVVDLIDAATGSRLTLSPGDAVRLGALAYSDVSGGGVEGPLALGSAGLFSTAPVGTDLWVPK